MRRPWPYQMTGAATVNVTTAPPRYEADAVGVGLIPDRSDRLISLHVGPCHIMLSCEEARTLASQLTALDRRYWQLPGNYIRRRADRGQS